ncbi:MAG: c-type cytochrome [Proteobacteria bacterium]|nr:c-type cytochrome [Pseudomonadota bacterium]
MKDRRKILSLGYLGLAIVVAIVFVAIYGIDRRPAPTPAPALSAAKTAEPPPASTAWPDYSSNGFGFVAPAGPDGALIGSGYELITRTFAVIGPDVADADKRFAGNNLACQSCHLDAGTKRTALPLVGIFGTYPKYSARSGRVISLAERIDECMTRSMNGRALPPSSPEMAGFLAYLRFLSGPEPVRQSPAPSPPEQANVARGEEVYGSICAACHQPNGMGLRWGSAADGRGYRFPPLWGPDSFNDGAGMDRYERAVGFILHNMPRGVDPAHPQLTLQQAWDVTAFLQTKPRPHYEPVR